MTTRTCSIGPNSENIFSIWYCDVYSLRPNTPRQRLFSGFSCKCVQDFSVWCHYLCKHQKLLTNFWRRKSPGHTYGLFRLLDSYRPSLDRLLEYLERCLGDRDLGNDGDGCRCLSRSLSGFSRLRTNRSFDKLL